MPTRLARSSRNDAAVRPSTKPGRGPALGLRPLVGTAVLIWLASGVAIFVGFDRWGDRGTFGDMFGAVNALFSALAFAAMYHAIAMQRKQITLQRKELRQTNVEMREARLLRAQPFPMVDAERISVTLTGPEFAISSWEMDDDAFTRPPNDHPLSFTLSAPIGLNLRNRGDGPAIAVVVGYDLVIPHRMAIPQHIVCSGVFGIDVVEPGATSGQFGKIVFDRFDSSLLLAAMSVNDLDRPLLRVRTVCRNAVGAAFEVHQALRLFLPMEVDVKWLRELQGRVDEVARLNHEFEAEMAEIGKSAAANRVYQGRFYPSDTLRAAHVELFRAAAQLRASWDELLGERKLRLKAFPIFGALHFRNIGTKEYDESCFKARKDGRLMMGDDLGWLLESNRHSRGGWRIRHSPDALDPHVPAVVPEDPHDVFGADGDDGSAPPHS